MKKTTHNVTLVTGLALCLVSALSWGQQKGPALNLSIEPQLLDSNFVTPGPDKASEAKLESGLAVSLDSHLLNFDVDYKLQGVLKEAAVEPGRVLRQSLYENTLAQKFNARLQSDLLNELLGANAGVSADTVFLEGGEVYRYKVTPGISRPLSRLAKLSVNYDYVLNKPSPQALAQEQRGYAMILDGSLHGGRLEWSSSYKNSNTFEDRLVLTRAIEALNLKSRYQLGASMHVELSSAFRQETSFAGTSEELLRETRYGASIAWSPSEQYSLAFKVNTREQEGLDRNDTFGSGTVSWFPRPDLEFTLDYGDKTVDGAPGWMLHTRIDISG